MTQCLRPRSPGRSESAAHIDTSAETASRTAPLFSICFQWALVGRRRLWLCRAVGKARLGWRMGREIRQIRRMRERCYQGRIQRRDGGARNHPLGIASPVGRRPY